MDVNDALNKLCLYSSILGYGKETDKGYLLECLGVSIYNNVREFTDDIGRYLELDVSVFKQDVPVCHYKSVYMFPKGNSPIFYGLKEKELKNFVDVMLETITYVSSFGASEECSFKIFGDIISFSDKLGKVSGKAELCAK